MEVCRARLLFLPLCSDPGRLGDIDKEELRNNFFRGSKKGALMALTFRKLHRHFVAEVSLVDLRLVHDTETLAQIRAGIDEYGILIFHDQRFADEEQIAFAQRLDGQLHTK